MGRRFWLSCTAVLAAAALVLAIATWQSLMPLPDSLRMGVGAGRIGATHFVAADGTPLNLSFDERFNRAAVRSLGQIPPLVRKAFVVSEDRRYWQHGGVDWLARFAALWQNLRAGHIVRGASTVGEQVARILEPRPRTYWTHWIAGFDAGRLLRRFGHARVLAFYLNQVPYGAQRRGVVQAARYYFGGQLDTLSPAEQLALAVMVRSPVYYDPRAYPDKLRGAVNELAARMRDLGVITKAQAGVIRRSPIVPERMPLPVHAGHFVVYADQRAQALGIDHAVIHTTLDPGLQRFVQQTLRRRVNTLANRGVRNGAALVVDNTTGAVLAWAVAPASGAYGIDPVLTRRQPGSALKPFVYGLAMAELGWQPSHIILDLPLTERIHSGVHSYRNYSGDHYGRVSLRYALGNSLNIPAVRTAQAVGVPAILDLLHRLGFSTLRQGAGYYGPAIALGDGAVTLFDMVQAYATLARRGHYLPLHVLQDNIQPEPVRVLPAPVTSLLADILSDPSARSAEFGANSVLNLARPTAVKTGTSSNYRDAWTMGFDDRYTVGVWMGRLDGQIMDSVTGSIGAAPVLRQIFARLRRTAPYAGLWHSPVLQPVQVCEWMGSPPCIQRREWYLPADNHTAQVGSEVALPLPGIARPLPGSVLYIDPRTPRRAQRFHFELDTAGRDIRRVVWQVDGKPLPEAGPGESGWTLQPGTHAVSARVWLAEQDKPTALGPVSFTVMGANTNED